MRILHVGKFYPPARGGMERVLQLLAEGERGRVDTRVLAANSGSRTVEEISTRFNEISFSSTLHSEIQGIALAKREAERRSFTFGRLERRLRRLNLHAIGPSASVALMDVASRLKTDARLLELLHSEGRAQANAWLAAHFDHIGVRSTLPLARHLRLAPA